jgi:hypothetical protein
VAAAEPLEVEAVGALVEVEFNEFEDVESEDVGVVAVPLAWEAVALCAASATVAAPTVAAAARPAVTTVT